MAHKNRMLYLKISIEIAILNIGLTGVPPVVV